MIVVKEDGSLKLECKATGAQQHDIIWSKESYGKYKEWKRNFLIMEKFLAKH